MKAIIFRNHGTAVVLEYVDIPIPTPGPGEALVKLHASSINHLDIWVRKGWPGIHLNYPHIPGADGAGVIAALGAGVSDWYPGDRVVINANLGCGHCEFCQAGKDNLCSNWKLLGETTPGTYCEYIAIPVQQLFRLPERMDFQTAAAAGLVYQTAWHSLMVRGRVQSGETVLVVGASGGVNTASIAIAKYAGARVIVIGTGPEKLATAQQLGADILIDRITEPEWSKAVFKVTNRKGADVVIDNVGTTYPLSFRAASKGGRILTVGNTGSPKFEIDNRFIFGKHLSIIGSTMGTIQDFKDVMSLVTEGRIKVALDHQYPLKEARAAQLRMENNLQLGKITLEI